MPPAGIALIVLIGTVGGSVLMDGVSGDRNPPTTDFYSAAVQIVPVLLLALVAELALRLRGVRDQDREIYRAGPRLRADVDEEAKNWARMHAEAAALRRRIEGSPVAQIDPALLEDVEGLEGRAQEVQVKFGEMGTYFGARSGPP